MHFALPAKVLQVEVPLEFRQVRPAAAFACDLRCECMDCPIWLEGDGMQQGNLAVRDPDRLAVLRRSGLLDAPADAALDRLTRLTARLLRVPVALVSVVDADRQVFKSAVGLGEPWASAREAPLTRSVCKHAVAIGSPLVVEDTERHPLPVDTPELREFGVRAYLGVPLQTYDGHVLGTLCGIDSEPREWCEEDIELLQELAISAMMLLQLRTLGAAQGKSDSAGEESFRGQQVLEATEQLWQAAAEFFERIDAYERSLARNPSNGAEEATLIHLAEVAEQRLHDADGPYDTVASADVSGIPRELLRSAWVLWRASHDYLEQLARRKVAARRFEQEQMHLDEVERETTLVRRAEHALRTALRDYRAARRHFRLSVPAAQ